MDLAEAVRLACRVQVARGSRLILESRTRQSLRNLRSQALQTADGVEGQRRVSVVGGRNNQEHREGRVAFVETLLQPRVRHDGQVTCAYLGGNGGDAGRPMHL